MILDVTLDLGAGNLQPAKMILKSSSTNPRIIFNNNDGEELIQDQLSLFKSIEVDDDNPLLCTFHGNSYDRTVTFADSSQQSDFWSFLEKHAKIAKLPGEGRIFSISIINVDQGLSKYVPKAVTSIVSSTVKTVKHFVVQKPDKIDTGETLSNGYHLGFISDEIPDDFSIQHHDWNLQGNSDDYQKLCVQWQQTTKGQWLHSYEYRKFVVNLESSVKKGFAPPYDSLIFQVVMSLYCFGFCTIQFNPVYITFLSQFAREFFPQAEGDHFISSDGNAHSVDDAAQVVFWPFKSFADRFLLPDNELPKLETLFLQVHSLLETVSPATVQLLDSRGVTSFDFFADEIRTYFTRDRSDAEIRMLIDALLDTRDLPRFMSCFVSAIFVLLQSYMTSLEDNPETFAQYFTGILPKLEMKLILYNAHRVNAMLDSAAKE